MEKAEDEHKTAKSQAGEEMDKDVAVLKSLTHDDLARGIEIYYFMGMRVLEHIKPDGTKITLKVKSPNSLKRSGGEMMHHAATHGVLAPRDHGCYDVVMETPQKPRARVLVSELVMGDALHTVWDDYTDQEKASVKEQLRNQLQIMRTITQPYIGRPNRKPFRNVYEVIALDYVGPFNDEEAFDDWCIARLKDGPLSRWKWKRWLKRKRNESSGKFVLTHGDLTPRNIMVQGSTITGIIDWETCAFLPEYAEYAFAMKLCHQHEDWWIPILKEVLEPCEMERLTFTSKIENRPG